MIGLWERINISVFLIWVVVLAIVLRRPPKVRQPIELERGCVAH